MAVRVQAGAGIAGIKITADTLAEYNEALADIIAASGFVSVIEDIANLTFTFAYDHTD